MQSDVHKFFSNWEVYRLCIEHNTLHHREVERILHEELSVRGGSFGFLDLACGDAELTARALAGTRVRCYTGVDFSAPAIEIACTKVAELGCPCAFHETDFTSYLRRNDSVFDVIYLGLSLHHLGRVEKGGAMKQIRAATAAGGEFYLFEPVLRGRESRDECLAEWHTYIEMADGPYAAFPPEAREALWQHVSTSDFPESEETYLALAREAGFSRGERLYTDARNFYSLFRFTT